MYSLLDFLKVAFHSPNEGFIRKSLLWVKFFQVGWLVGWLFL